MSSKYITLKMIFGDVAIEISKNSVYRLLAGGLTGVEAAEYLVSLDENALLDGAYITSEKLSPRNIGINFCVTDRKNSEIYRHYLISAINPKKAGTLIIERSGISRKIDFRVNGAPTFTQNNIFTDRLHVSLNLICPDPWFCDVQQTDLDMAEVTPLLTFPFNSVKGVGISSGVLWRSKEMEISNTGDGPTGVIVEITANGSIENPYVECNGKYIKAIYTMKTNDVMEFSTVERKKGIRVNGKSMVNYDRKSVFFELPVGTSVLQIGAKSGSGNASAKIKYSLRYLGV